MFRIRRIYDEVIPINKLAIAQVQAMMRSQFPDISEDDIIKLPEKLRNPLKHGFRSVLFVADDLRGQVKGFAFVYHEPALKFFYLDYISSSVQFPGRGIGGALYERLRQEALALKTIGVFFECLPDDPQLSKNPVIRKQNIARLRFYERFGARPVINTAYETPLKPGEDNPPYLVYDNLGQEFRLPRDQARLVVRAILEKKYGNLCPPQYVNMVVNSFQDDPVKLREPRYVKNAPSFSLDHSIPTDKKIALIINDKHEIHHVHERGYVESPVRIKTILKEIEPTGLFDIMPVKHFPDKFVKMVHDTKYVDYFRKVCESVAPNKTIYPYVFPIRNSKRPPRDLPIQAGYYCIDTFTPLNQNAYLAARRAVDCAITAASLVLEGQRIAYALVRPPGHHAEWSNFGGFCYFNSNAAAANYLSSEGTVAILDIDYHHGNGQQDIFYQRPDVLTVSIHGHPGFAYPYFSGFEEEKGAGLGEGFNANFPLPEQVDGKHYLAALHKAINKIRKFKPEFLVVALGLDPAKGDPTGSWSLQGKDFENNGQLVGELGLPTVVVQEGGYNHRNLGINARHFFIGLWRGMYSAS
ncbi:MAG: histone deacetylase family protein [Calditrichia bacterium]